MHDVTHWQHSHDNRIDAQHHAERRTRWVIALTAVTMVVELVAGILTGSMALLDAEDHGEAGAQIRALVERDAETRIADLHIWRVGPRSRACILSLVTHVPRQADFYKEMLAQVPHLDHVTVEINHCTPDLCPATQNRT